MGLTCYSAIWQRKIQNILSRTEGITIFMDDIEVTGETDEIHFQRLKQVLEKSRECNIKINKE